MECTNVLWCNCMLTNLTTRRKRTLQYTFERVHTHMLALTITCERWCFGGERAGGLKAICKHLRKLTRSAQLKPYSWDQKAAILFKMQKRPTEEKETYWLTLFLRSETSKSFSRMVPSASLRRRNNDLPRNASLFRQTLPNQPAHIIYIYVYIYIEREREREREMDGWMDR